MRFPKLLGPFLIVIGLFAGSIAPATAQSREAAQLAVRVQELEEQLRLLTGQIEGLQFQLTQMQTLVERMSKDNEFRFQQLEGGAPAAPPPADQQGDAGAVVEERLQPDPTTTAALGAGESVVELGDGEPLHDPLGEPMEDLGDLGDSSDPLVGSNGAAGQEAALGGRPLDLTLDSGAPLSNGDATAQYQAGYDAIVRGDYAFAEDQFQQFVALYPDDPNAADATNWLGEALLQRGAYDDAALVLAEGYQKYTESPRAPDLLLKLGVALFGAGEQEVACRTFFTLEKRYPGQPAAFAQRLHDEKARAQCPA